jgi:hypothetical protein
MEFIRHLSWAPMGSLIKATSSSWSHDLKFSRLWDVSSVGKVSRQDRELFRWYIMMGGHPPIERRWMAFITLHWRRRGTCWWSAEVHHCLLKLAGSCKLERWSIKILNDWTNFFHCLPESSVLTHPFDHDYQYYPSDEAFLPSRKIRGHWTCVEW